jgi:hypothetical protein
MRCVIEDWCRFHLAIARRDAFSSHYVHLDSSLFSRERSPRLAGCTPVRAHKAVSHLNDLTQRPLTLRASQYSSRG